MLRQHRRVEPGDFKHGLLIMTPRFRVGHGRVKVHTLAGADERLEMLDELPLRVVP